MRCGPGAYCFALCSASWPTPQFPDVANVQRGPSLRVLYSCVAGAGSGGVFLPCFTAVATFLLGPTKYQGAGALRQAWARKLVVQVLPPALSSLKVKRKIVCAGRGNGLGRLGDTRVKIRLGVQWHVDLVSGKGRATIPQRFQDQIFKEQEELQQVCGRWASAGGRATCVCRGLLRMLADWLAKR